MTMRGGRIGVSKRRALLLIPIWVVASYVMWSWWFAAAQIGNIALYLPLTAALLFEYVFVPVGFTYFLLRAKIPKKHMPLRNAKVAVITPCVPAKESLKIIERQLRAMSSITYPHDSWILDEGNNRDVKRLAKKYGVIYFSRKGISKYNRPVYPYKSKTKAGNINAWLDHVKRRKYDFFVQLDIDHEPIPSYLNKTLGHFRDKRVGWVQAPSVYSNLTHWTARGSTEQEMGLHGPLQMGFYGANELPVVVGSHTTFRMSAVRDIGGFQETRAEDHLNTIALAGKDWKGVFVPEVIASGDGPETLNAYVSQQYAWAYSMFQITLYYRKLFKKLSLSKRVPFIFLQTWYPARSISCCVLFLIPALSLLFNAQALEVSFRNFMVRFLPLALASYAFWWAARPLRQPQNIRLSWRGILLHIASWPVILRGLFDAAYKIKRSYQITPKGKFLKITPTIGLYFPFLLLSFAGAAAILIASWLYGTNITSIQIGFVIINILAMVAICAIDLNVRLRRDHIHLKTLRQHWLKPVAAVYAAILLLSASLLAPSSVVPSIAEALSQPSTPILAREPESLRPRDLTDKELLFEISKPATVAAPKKAPKLGIYDPKKVVFSPKPYIRHTFVDWRESRVLAEFLLETKRMGKTPLVTIVPNGDKNGHRLLSQTTKGKYDKRLNRIFTLIHAYGDPVYIRYAHEMELGKLYPWGAQKPALFKQAYRHVVRVAHNNKATNTKWVWSPGGNPGAESYYPGHDVVDVVGTTVLYDRYWTGDYYPSFSDLSWTRRRMQQFGKPVWIVEFGAGNANPTFQKALIREAAKTFQQYGFSALLYINIPDSNIKGPNYLLKDPDFFGDLLGRPKPLVRKNIPPAHFPTESVNQHEQPQVHVNFKTLKTLDY